MSKFSCVFLLALAAWHINVFADPPTQLPPVTTIAPGIHGAFNIQHFFEENFPTVAETLNGVIPDALGLQPIVANVTAAGAPNPCGKSSDGSAPVSPHPVVISSGMKILREKDFTIDGQQTFDFVRTYNEAYSGRGIFGPKWLSPFDLKLSFTYSDGSYCEWMPATSHAACSAATPTTVTFQDADGGSYPYATGGGHYVDSKTAPTSWIERVGVNYIRHDASNGTQTFDQNGRLVSMLDAYGVGWSLAYAAPYNISSATHSSGRVIGFTWSGAGGSVLTTISLPSGVASYTYSYSAGNLAGVAYGSNGGTRTYFYENSGLPYALTGIAINGNRYSTYSYYANGQVQQSGLTSGVEQDSFTYSTNQTTVNTYMGQTAVYTFQQIQVNGATQTKVATVDRPGVINCKNAAAHFTYDVNGYLSAKTGWNNVETDYSRDAAGRLLQETDGIDPARPTQQRITKYIWDTAKNRFLNVQKFGATTADPYNETVYSYYPDTDVAHDRLQSVTVYNRTSNGVANQAQTTTYAYTIYPNHLLQQMIVDGPAPGSVDAVTYNFSANGDLATVVNAFGQQRSYTNYNGFGLPQAITDENALTTTTTYDGKARTIYATRMVAGSARTMHYIYDGLDNVTEVQNPDNSYIDTTYDAVGRAQWVGNGSNNQIVYTYTPFWRQPLKVQKVQLQQYQIPCNPQQQSAAQGGAMAATVCVPKTGTRTVEFYSHQWTYDIVGHVATSSGNNGQKLTYAYDGNDNVTSVTDALNHVINVTYTTLDQPWTVQDGAGGITTYTYDAGRNVYSVQDSHGAVTYYAHDGLGNLTETNSPDSGVTLFQYDAGGRLSQRTRADNTVTTYGYDGLGRIQTVAGPGQTLTYNYDSCSNGIGRICGFSDSSGNTSYSYDADSNLATQIATISGTTYTTGWTYDALHRITQLSYPGGNSVLYTYDSEQHVSGISATVAGVTSTFASGFSYNPFGPLTSLNFANGSGRSSLFDHDYRVTSIGSGVTGASLALSYDAADRVSQITDSAAQSIGYDNANRLTSVTSSVGNQSFSFDANGNRTSGTTGGITDTYAVNSFSNRIDSISGSRARIFTPNNVGNVASISGWGAKSLNYDGFNRMSGVVFGSSSTTYTLNTLNQRVRKAGPGGNFNFVYAPDGVLLGETAAGSTSLSTQYIYLNGMPVGLIRNNILYYIHDDHLGRPLAATNAVKSIVWKAQSTIFDRTVNLNSIGGLNIGFPGQYYDSESGLYYNGARYYDPSTGRYLQSDPTGLAGGLNTYTYVDGNPTTFFDPWGLDKVTVNFYGGGSGHIGISVNGGPSYGYYGGGLTTSGFVSGSNGQGAVLLDQSLQGNPTQTVTINVTPAQAATIQQSLNKLRQDPPQYNLYGSNCATNAEKTLTNAGIPNIPSTIFPASLIEDMQQTFYP